MIIGINGGDLLNEKAPFLYVALAKDHVTLMPKDKNFAYEILSLQKHRASDGRNSRADALLFECSAFPRHKHDDYMDAWSQAAGQLTSSVDYTMFNERVNVFAGLPPGFRSPW